MMRTAARICTLFVLLGAAAAAAAAAPPGSGKPEPAAPQSQPTSEVFVSPTGSDAGPCTRAAPCASFDRAYQAVAPGGTVFIGDGTYGPQEINLDPTKASTSGRVVFRPAPGARPVVQDRLALGDGSGTPAPSQVTLRDITITGELDAFTPGSDLTFVDLDASNFYLRGVQHVLIEGGDWGPCREGDPGCGGNSKIDEPGGEQPNDDITIDGATFHDYRSSTHFECVFIAAGTNITIENSKFFNCEFYDIFLQHFDSPIANLTLQNNWFDTPWNGAGVQDRNSALGFSPRGVGFTDVLIRYNSFSPLTGIAYNDDFGDTSVYSNFRIVGNLIGTANYCDPSQITFEYNVFTDGFCGPTDKQAELGYVSDALAPAWNWHLRSSAAAVDFVPGTDADQRLGSDIDWQRRPSGAAWDAGADELLVAQD